MVSDNDIVLSVEEVVALERRIEAEGTSLYTLMHRAGTSVAEWICDALAVSSAGLPGVADVAGLPGASEHIVILCGSGNNGGDGWVIADKLAAWGYCVSVITATPADSLQAEPARQTALEIAAKAHELLTVYLNPDAELLKDLARRARIIVDAILGTGFNGLEVRSPYDSWIHTVNATRSALPGKLPLVVAVDAPSGLSAQSGQAAEPTIMADATITMIAYKPGLLMPSSKLYCGTLSLAQLVVLDGLLSSQD